MKPAIELIVIGTSWGGLRALIRLLPAFSHGLGCPIAIVQHRLAGVEDTLSAMLDRYSPLRVGEAQDKQRMQPGHVYLAPADYHLLIETRGELALSTAAPVNAARPSIDVLFESAAAVYGRGVAGVVLTGASADGARGLAAIKAGGGLALVQDPATAECAVMPVAAIGAAPVDAVLPLEEMASRLARVAHARG